MTQRMTAEDFRAAQAEAAAKGPNKFGAQKTEINGIRFDSKREAMRYLVLRNRERLGEVRDLRLQVPIMLQGRDGPLLSRTGKPMRLTVDFAYVECATGLEVFEDAKGKATRDYEVRRAVAAAQGVEVIET